MNSGDGMIDHEEQQVQINIYESDEEEKNESLSRSSPSRSGSLTRSIVQLEPPQRDLELQKFSKSTIEVMGSEKTKDSLGYYELEAKYLHYKESSK